MSTVQSPVGTPFEWRALLRRFAPLGIGAVIAVLITGAWRQAIHPFFEHDDWYYLLSTSSPRRPEMYGRLLAEGRWLNYWWTAGPGQLMTPVSASLLFLGSALVLSGLLARRWAPGWQSLPVLVALFASPMIVELSFWSATLSLSMLVSAVAVWLLPRCVARPRLLILWVVAATSLTFLTYPPTTVLIFVVLIVELIDRSWRELTLVTALFGASYVVSTLVVFTLNKVAFGTFGVVARPWRHPNPIHNLGDVGENLKRAAQQLGNLAEAMTIPIVLGLLAIIGCLFLPELRLRTQRLLVVIVVAIGVQLAPTILSGVDEPNRISIWVWVIVVAALTWLGRALLERRTPWVAVGVGLALVVTGLWGARVWQHAIDYNQQRLAAYDRVDDRLDALLVTHPHARVLIYGSPADWGNPDVTQEAQYFQLTADYDGETSIFSNCRLPHCTLGLRPAVVARVARGARVIVAGRFLMLVPPSHYRPRGSFSIGH